MRGYLAFTKKEFLEQLRTYKLLIIVCVFFLFGMMSPLTAKLLPDIFSGMKVEGMTIIIPDPTAMDAYGQFFKNTTQMGMLVILLVFGGSLSNELTKGTLVNILAKGLTRPTVILSKFTAMVLLWTAGFALDGLTCYGYTVYLFKGEAVDNLLFSMFCLWLFGCFVLSLILLSSTLTGGNFGGLILSAGVLAALLMVNMFPKLVKYNPVTLASKNMALINNTEAAGDVMITVWITLILTAAAIAASMMMFSKKRL